MVWLCKSKIYWKRNTFIIWIKTDDVYKDIAEDVESRFDTSNYILQMSLPKGKSKKVTYVIKNELGVQIMNEFVGLREKTCIYSVNDGSED